MHLVKSTLTSVLAFDRLCKQKILVTQFKLPFRWEYSARHGASAQVPRAITHELRPTRYGHRTRPNSSWNERKTQVIWYLKISENVSTKQSAVLEPMKQQWHFWQVWFQFSHDHVGAIGEEEHDRLWTMLKSGDPKREMQAKKEFLIMLPSCGKSAYLWFCHLLQQLDQETLWYMLGRWSTTSRCSSTCIRNMRHCYVR